MGEREGGSRAVSQGAAGWESHGMQTVRDDQDISPILAGIELALQVQKDMSPKATLKEFKDKLEDPKYRGELKALREEVEAFAATFPLPGLPVL